MAHSHGWHLLSYVSMIVKHLARVNIDHVLILMASKRSSLQILLPVVWILELLVRV